MANFYADLIKTEFNTDVAFFNTGTIRSDELIKSGYITYDTINKIFAVPDYVVVLIINGQQLHQVLENGVSKWPSFDGRFLGISAI